MELFGEFLWYCVGVIMVAIVYCFLVEVTCSIYFKNKLGFINKLGRSIIKED